MAGIRAPSTEDAWTLVRCCSVYESADRLRLAVQVRGINNAHFETSFLVIPVWISLADAAYCVKNEAIWGWAERCWCADRLRKLGKHVLEYISHTLFGLRMMVRKISMKFTIITHGLIVAKQTTSVLTWFAFDELVTQPRRVVGWGHSICSMAYMVHAVRECLVYILCRYVVGADTVSCLGHKGWWSWAFAYHKHSIVYRALWNSGSSLVGSPKEPGLEMHLPLSDLWTKQQRADWVIKDRIMNTSGNKVYNDRE